MGWPHKPGPRQAARMNNIREQIELDTIVGKIEQLNKPFDLSKHLPGTSASDLPKTTPDTVQITAETLKKIQDQFGAVKHAMKTPHKPGPRQAARMNNIRDQLS